MGLILVKALPVARSRATAHVLLSLIKYIGTKGDLYHTFRELFHLCQFPTSLSLEETAKDSASGFVSPPPPTQSSANGGGGPLHEIDTGSFGQATADVTRAPSSPAQNPNMLSQPSSSPQSQRHLHPQSLHLLPPAHPSSIDRFYLRPDIIRALSSLFKDRGPCAVFQFEDVPLFPLTQRGVTEGGYSWSSWINAPSLRDAASNMFSFLAESGWGVQVYLHSNKIRVRCLPQAYETVAMPNFEVRPGTYNTIHNILHYI